MDGRGWQLPCLGPRAQCEGPWREGWGAGAQGRCIWEEGGLRARTILAPLCYQQRRAEWVWRDEHDSWESDPRSSSDTRYLWLPVTPVSSRHPKPSTWRQSVPTLLHWPCRPTSTLVRGRADRDGRVHCRGGHTYTSSRVAGQVSAGDGREGPVPSLLWLTQVCKFPFLQQSPGFFNPGCVM